MHLKDQIAALWLAVVVLLGLILFILLREPSHVCSCAPVYTIKADVEALPVMPLGSGTHGGGNGSGADDLASTN